MDESNVRVVRATSPSDEPYVVRLGGGPPQAPPTQPASAHDEPSTTYTPMRSRRPRWPRNLAVALVALGVLVFQWEAVQRITGRAVDAAKEPIHRIEGEDHLRRATFAMGTLWQQDGTHDVTSTRLKEVAPEVKWGDTVLYRTCFGGAGAVLVGRTATGDVSRLILSGTERGDVAGNHECPISRDRREPWSSY